MSSAYYQEHTLFVEQIKRFISSELAPHTRKWESEGFFPNDVFKSLGQQGFLGILLPEKYGGIAGDYKLAGAWCEAFGELCDVGLTTAVNMHALVITPAIARYGSEQAKEKWLSRATQGELIGAYAFTEPGAGSDLASLRTRAVQDGKDWIINGSKTFITNGARANFILVLTRTDQNAGYKGFTTFIVDTTLPGFKVNRKLDKLGWQSSDTAELIFEDVRVDQSCILGNVGEGWLQASNNLNWERLMLTLTSLGGAKACLREVFKYTKDRIAFGDSIIELELVSQTIREMYRKITISESISHKALDLLLSGVNCRAEVSAAKRLVCEYAVWIADRAIQLHGGYGYTKEFNAERWWRDLRLMPIGGGTSEIMAEIVIKELGL